MKRIPLLLLPAFLLLCTCKNKKAADPEPDFGAGCINRIYPSFKGKLSPKNQARADSLFLVNNLTIPVYLVPYSYEQLATTINTRFIQDDIVRFDQYANKQILFLNELIYSFINKKFNVISGSVYNGSLKIDTISHLNNNNLRNIFLKQVLADSFNSNKNFKDSCLIAQFGYFDINAGNSLLPKGNFVKAWKVTAQNSYPQLYVRDDGVLISYFNGIYTTAKP